jgi:hypothetical protein
VKGSFDGTQAEMEVSCGVPNNRRLGFYLTNAIFDDTVSQILESSRTLIEGHAVKVWIIYLIAWDSKLSIRTFSLLAVLANLDTHKPGFGRSFPTEE